MRRLGWRYYGGLGALAVGCYPLLSVGVGQDVAYVAIGLSCVAAIVVGLWLHRPLRRMPWYLMAGGQLLWVIGDAIDSWYQDVDHVSPFPSAADAFYLAAYPILALGLLLLIRGRRPRRDVAGLLDSATLTAGLGMLSWVLLARPTLARLAALGRRRGRGGRLSGRRHPARRPADPAGHHPGRADRRRCGCCWPRWRC